jgi:hypothetical protein
MFFNNLHGSIALVSSPKLAVLQMDLQMAARNPQLFHRCRSVRISTLFQFFVVNLLCREK